MYKFIIAEKILDWEPCAITSCWFGQDGHYKEDFACFNPDANTDDALYVLEYTKCMWTIESDQEVLADGSFGPIIYNCILYRDEGKIEEKHPVDTWYIATADTVPIAICKALLKAYKLEE